MRIIAKHYGKLISLQEIREYSETTGSGSNLLKLSEAAEATCINLLGSSLSRFNKPAFSIRWYAIIVLLNISSNFTQYIE
ncbi:MAG: hypothetical protein HUJ21_17605 [Cyclobacterium sp.]|nr:hypothetical protein [Cyclobacterium sp.]